MNMELSHNEFTSAYTSGRIKVLVNQELALKIVWTPLLPLANRIAAIFWGSVALLIIPFSFYLMFATTWWIGLLVLFFVRPAICSACLATAQQWVLEFSLKNPKFYEIAAETGAIVIEPND